MTATFAIFANADGHSRPPIATITRAVDASGAVRYHGKRYSLRGGIRTPYFITLSLPRGR